MKNPINLTILFILLFCAINLQSQVYPGMYWVEFTDKNDSTYSIDNPEDFLSARAINRRYNQGIAINETDLPVKKTYLDSLKSLGVQIHNVSKWFNGAVIITTDTNLLDTLQNLSFIKSLDYDKSTNSINDTLSEEFDEKLKATSEDNYELQLNMLNLETLHDDSLKGEGMLIAILDAGFKDADSLESLEHVWNDNRVLITKDFVKDSTDIFASHYHGTMVFSIIAGAWENKLLGAAPEASFLLIRTENNNSEYLIEEYNWLAGAEFADSAGADLINSSLGYCTFDDNSQDHTYSDLDGNTTPVTKAARMAARKGILVVNSAGNEGNDSWYNILAPADADSILSVGAVNKDEELASFSSRGPSYDDRIKPDVCARGQATYGQKDIGSVTQGNGTSFSAPLITGMSACLWENFPNATNQQIRTAILQSSDRYSSPDNDYGYGIPNIALAKTILKETMVSSDDTNLTDSESTNLELSSIRVFPNPTQTSATIILKLPWLESSKTGYVTYLDYNGQMLNFEEITYNPGLNIIHISETMFNQTGLYFIRCEVYGKVYHCSLIKTE